MPKKDVNEVDLDQQNVGPGGEEGGGEWPDPETPPTGPAPGTETEPRPSGGFKKLVEDRPTAGGQRPARPGEQAAR